MVSGFLHVINEHREKIVTPSDYICVDESMSRWYGLGGGWIDNGLQHYVALHRKPENVCQTRTAACEEIAMMIRLKVVKGPTESEAPPFGNEFSASSATTLQMVKQWLRSDRVVGGGSWSASAATAQALTRYNMKFIAIFKNETREFPMEKLS